jgi:hypothetical protein
MRSRQQARASAAGLANRPPMGHPIAEQAASAGDCPSSPKPQPRMRMPKGAE